MNNPGLSRLLPILHLLACSARREKFDSAFFERYIIIMTISTNENIRAVIEESATLIVETIPRVMATLRADLRHATPEEISVPHFRALAFLEQTPGASVCAVARHLGFSVSNVSKLLYALAERGFVAHTASRDDRRRSALSLTAHGAAMLHAARRIATERLVTQLAEKVDSVDDLAGISAAMRCLSTALGLNAQVRDC